MARRALVTTTQITNWAPDSQGVDLTDLSRCADAATWWIEAQTGRLLSENTYAARHSGSKAADDGTTLYLADPDTGFATFPVAGGTTPLTATEGGVALTVYDLSYTGAWGTAEIAIVNRARGTVLRAEAVDGRLELRTWEAGEGNISLVYTAGYATGPSEVPPDLEQLAIELAWLMYREGARNGLESLAEVGASLTFVRLLSPSARAALNAYRARRFPWTMLG